MAIAPDFPAPYPAHLTTALPLGLAHSISVRPVTPEDADIEVEFVGNLSQQSRYNRFLGGGVALTPELLKKLTHIDFGRDMALIATVTLEGMETAIGMVQYVRLEDAASAEFAIVIADIWQGSGIGSRLLALLLGCARDAGLGRVMGDTLATNTPMLHLARSQGFRIERHPDGAELRRLILDL